MTKEMRVLLESLVASAKVQIDMLKSQIIEFEDLLSQEEGQRIMDQSDYENRPRR